MRWSEAFIPTLKEKPAEAEVTSHILMIRAGLIRKLASGAYSYLPLGLSVLQKVEAIIRNEMNAKGAIEVFLPAIHPPELWERTGRLAILGEDMIIFTDRHGKKNVLGPTHEEVITDLVAHEVRSYKNLPLIFYQIQTKFRDEPRPRFGVIRSREFIMKDAYSFDIDVEGLNKSYKKMYDAYCRIFERTGLGYIAVEADPGFMGGNVSHEFMVPAENGEDIIVLCASCKYAASFSKAECKRTTNDEQRTANNERRTTRYEIREVDTPGTSSVEAVSNLLKVKPSQLIKTLIYEADGTPVAVLIRGDHDLNEAKLTNLLKCRHLAMADENIIEKVTGGPLGFSGPVGLSGIRIIADYAIAGIANGVTGANKKDKHLVNVNVDRDFKIQEWADVRYITTDDPCPRCGKKIEIKQAIEVGHTFKLGTRYSESLDAKYLDEKGNEKTIIMGCYGIGVNRIIAACIEQNNDKNGIIWPKAIAPYQVLVLPVDSTDKKLIKAAEDIYEELKEAGFEVLLDDRPERAGVKFKDADLIGIPVRVVIGEAMKAKGKLEVKLRSSEKAELIARSRAKEKIKRLLTKAR